MAYGYPSYTPRYADSIAALLARQGDIAARSAERTGEIWGNTINQLGQIVGGAVQQHQEKKTQEKQQAIFNDALASFDPNNPAQTYRKLAVGIGAKSALEVINGLKALQKPEMDSKSMENILRAAKVTKDTVGDEAFARDYYPHIAQKVGPTLQAQGMELPPPELAGKYIDNWHAQLNPSKVEKTPEQLFAEAKARAAGERAGAPPVPPKAAPTLAEIEAEAAARARGTASVKPARGATTGILPPA